MVGHIMYEAMIYIARYCHWEFCIFTQAKYNKGLGAWTVVYIPSDF